MVHPILQQTVLLQYISMNSFIHYYNVTDSLLRGLPLSKRLETPAQLSLHICMSQTTKR